MEYNLSGMKVAILVSDNFEQVELSGPRAALDAAGASTEIISEKPGTVQGVNHDQKADRFPVDATFEKARPEDYDAVLLPGGAMSADYLRNLPPAQDFIRAIDRAGKPVAVICHGAWLLVSAGLVKGRTLTSWHSIQDDIRNAGGVWVDEEVMVDGNLISSRKPRDIPAFNSRVIDEFDKYWHSLGSPGRANAQTRSVAARVINMLMP